MTNALGQKITCRNLNDGRNGGAGGGIYEVEMDYNVIGCVFRTTRNGNQWQAFPGGWNDARSGVKSIGLFNSKREAVEALIPDWAR